MVEFNYTVQDPLGIHARPAGQIARYVKTHGGHAKVTVEKVGGKTVDALRVMALMTLGAKPGDVLHITVDGDEAEAVSEGLKELLQNEKL